MDVTVEIKKYALNSKDGAEWEQRCEGLVALKRIFADLRRWVLWNGEKKSGARREGASSSDTSSFFQDDAAERESAGGEAFFDADAWRALRLPLQARSSARPTSIRARSCRLRALLERTLW